jgi:polyketide cyclase/dehydrase/lipid transport protein
MSTAGGHTFGMLGTMTRWYALEPADGGFFTAAPHVFRYSKRYAAPPEKVWESLASEESIGAWSATVGSVKWLSPQPFGIDTTREVALAPGLTRVRERFFRWDEGHGYSFEVYEANLPLFRRFAEDYEVEPDGDATRFTWTVALEPKSALAIPFKPLATVLKLAFGRLAADGEKYFARS